MNRHVVIYDPPIVCSLQIRFKILVVRKVSCTALQRDIFLFFRMN